MASKKHPFHWPDYLPLLVIILLTLLAAVAKQFAYSYWNWMRGMHDFMGFFLVIFSMFKFFDLRGFADGFQKYDLLAKAFRPYAFAYPFLELTLGLGFLSVLQLTTVYTATLILFTFSSIGVIKALLQGLDLQCACLGTVLKVPLSTVALVEDLAMALMSAGMLFVTLT